MRPGQVLGHAIHFENFQIQLLEPGNDVRGQRGSAGQRNTALIQPHCAQHFLLDHLVQEGNFQQLVQLLGRHRLRSLLVELGPDTRHREEYCRLGALDVFTEGFQRLGKEYLSPYVKLSHFYCHALGHMREGQIGNHAFLRRQIIHLDHFSPDCREGEEIMHNTLWHTRGARGVNNGGDIFHGRFGHLLDRRRIANDVAPVGEIVQRIAGSQSERHSLDTFRHTFFHDVPVIQLADEKELGLTVLHDLADRFCDQRRVQRHADCASHPDRKVGNNPFRTVFRNQCHMVTFLNPLRLQVSRHFASFIIDPGPGIVLQLTTTHGLNHGH